MNRIGPIGFFLWLVLTLGIGTIKTPAWAVTFHHVAGLGDSLLDDSAGVRSPVVAEHLAAMVGVDFTNFALSGSTSTTLLTQGQHLSAAAQFGAGDLAVVWIGGNDFFQNALSVALGNFGFMNTLQSNVTTAVSTLRSAGMDVLLLNLPDMSRVPAVQNAGIGLANFRSASLQWRSRLDQVAVAQGAAVVDVFSLFDELNTDPTDFSILGRVPVLSPTYGCQLCAFADQIHPSSVAQGFVANRAAGVLEQVFDPTGTMPLSRISTVTLASYLGITAGDFNDDHVYTLADIDSLVSEIASSSDAAAFDLSGDGHVDADDLDIWRQVAGAANLPSGNAYLVGDANLDGVVDGSDFSLWNASKFTSTPRWSSGDFNADGFVDGSDFGLWNASKFQASAAVQSMVPEPSSIWLLGWLMLTRPRALVREQRLQR
jgi:lysophospholipase L1-like esterase